MSAVQLKVVSETGRQGERRQIAVLGTDFTPVLAVVRRAWLIGVGATAMAGDEVGHFANTLVERGQQVQKDGQKRMAATRQEARRTTHMVEETLEHVREGVLHRLGVPSRSDVMSMNLPSRGDIEVLSNRVAALTKQVEQLRKTEAPRREEAEALAGKVDALAKKVDLLRKMEEPQARETELLAGKIGTLTRKVNDLQKAEEAEAEAPEKAEPKSKSESKKS